MGAILGIDTSGARSHLALLSSDGAVLGESSGGNSDSHNEELSLLCHDLLRSAGIGARDLVGIGIGVGPGSFTGLRIGVAFSEGLSFSLSIPLWGISTFMAAAWEHRSQGEWICVMSDARRHELYAALYRIRGAEMEMELAPSIIANGEVERSVLDITGGIVPFVVGADGVAMAIPEGWRCTGAVRLGVAVAELAKRREESTPGGEAVIPLYVRPMAAQSIAERMAQK